MVFKVQSRPKYTSQMASFRGLKDENFNLEISNRPEKKSQWNKATESDVPLEPEKWNDHVKDIANSSYGVLLTLRKLKNFTD